MKIVHVLVSGEVTRAAVVKENHLTILVMLPDGNVIKRHKRKHLLQQ